MQTLSRDGLLSVSSYFYRSIYRLEFSSNLLTVNLLAFMPSPGSCRSTSGKHRLLQYSRVSPGSIARHDPEASCGSPDGRDGGEEEQTPPRIRQSVSTHIQLMRFSKPFSPHESRFLACVCRWIMASGPLDHAEQERRKWLPRLDMGT